MVDHAALRITGLTWRFVRCRAVIRGVRAAFRRLRAGRVDAHLAVGYVGDARTYVRARRVGESGPSLIGRISPAKQFDPCSRRTAAGSGRSTQGRGKCSARSGHRGRDSWQMWKAGRLHQTGGSEPMEFGAEMLVGSEAPAFPPRLWRERLWLAGERSTCWVELGAQRQSTSTALRRRDVGCRRGVAAWTPTSHVPGARSEERTVSTPPRLEKR